MRDEIRFVQEDGQKNIGSLGSRDDDQCDHLSCAVDFSGRCWECSMLHSREIPMARTAEVDSEGAPQHVEEKLSNIEVTRSPCLFR